jgi:hypothetical protein
VKRAGVVIVALLVVAGAAVAANPRLPKKVIIPAVQAKAKAINVHLSDLPKGDWTAKPSAPDSGTPHCSYYNPDQHDLTENGNASSPDFTAPSASFVSSSTSIFKTAAQGRTAYKRVVQPKLPKCLAEIFRKGISSSGKMTNLTALPLPFPKLGERSNAYRISGDFSNASGSIAVFLDVVVFNRAKVDTVIFFAGIGRAFLGATEQSVAGKVAARAANA